LESTPCNTILENKAKYWSSQTNWGEFVVETTTVQCPQPPVCELELTKTDDPDPLQPGDPLTYHLTLKNTGTADCTGTGVRIKDVFDQYTTYASSSRTPEEITSTYIKWNVGTLHPQDEINIDLNMNVLESTPCNTILENKAKYWSSQTNWGEFVVETTTVQCPQPPVCDPEIELISNGNFELPIVSASQLWDIFDSGTANLNWMVEWRSDIPSTWGEQTRPDPAHLEIQRGVNGWLPYEGSQYAELDTDWDGPAGSLNNEPASVKIYQDIVTIPGENYNLSFSFSPRPSTPESDNILQIKWNDNILGTPSGAGLSNTDWSEYNYNFTAQSDVTRLEFADLGTANSLGTFVDEVSLRCQPITNTTGTIFVIKNVVGGQALPSDFVINVSGDNPLPATFTGQASPGTEVVIGEGAYGITEEAVSNYTASYSTDCSSTIMAGETKTCTITNTYTCQPSVTINASKIVCQTETDLPNWGDGGPDITATTAQDFVDNNQNCHFASGWDFEWAQFGVSNPGDNIIGPAGSGWTTFGPTDINGLTNVSINSVSGDRLWFREVMKEGYIPFSGDTSAPRDNISAEFYCHQDVLNYDNYDYVLNPQLGQNYHCVAFNVLATTTEPTSTLIVIDHVIGGTATSGDFTVNVTGTNPVPASFPGEEAPGTTVILEPGAYNVNQSTLPNYVTSYSTDCSSTIMAGETKTCTITNLYQEEPPSTSTLIVIDHVVGGTATSGNFTVYVSGNSPSTTSFPGEESPGTAIIISPGSYGVTQSTLPNYTTSYSDNCSSTILASEIKTCTITNTYQCIPVKPCSELGCNQTDSCGNYCGNCGGPSPYCGDGAVNSGEECDGNAGVPEGYTCTASCKLERKICKMDINVMMVLDVSGSMGYNAPTRLSQAKIAANGFIDNLRSGDQSGLVSFNWTAALNKKLSNNHASTKLAVNGLTAVGATNIGDAVDKANEELMSATSSLNVAKIQILLTDGRANQPNGNGYEENPLDLALVLDKSLEAAKNGIMIFTIGLGPDINENMLRNIAQNTGGKYYFAPTSNDLTGIFNEIASETCKSTSTAYESPAIKIFNAAIRSVSDTSVTISWYTNVPATSRVVYSGQKVLIPGSTPNYGYTFSTPEQDSANKTIFHSVTISGLTPNKTYYWRPISRGSPEIWGEELSFTTKAETSISEETNEETTSSIETVQEVEEETQELLPEFNENLNQEEEKIVNPSLESQSFFAFLSSGAASIFDALRSLFGHKIFTLTLLIIIVLLVFLLLRRRRKEEEVKPVIPLEQQL